MKSRKMGQISRCGYHDGELMDLNGVDLENASERKKFNDFLIYGRYVTRGLVFVADPNLERFPDAEPSSSGYHDRRS